MGASYLLTTDKQLLKKMASEPRISVIDPVDFIRAQQEHLNENGYRIRHDGVAMLIKTLGPVEAERFIALINRERFNYTEWRKTQWLDETVTTLAEKARNLRSVSK